MRTWFAALAIGSAALAGPGQAATPVTVIALGGAPATGTPAGVIYNFFGLNGPPVLNGPGQVAFDAILFGPGVNPSTDAALFGPDLAGNYPSLIARDGSPAPGVGSGVNFTLNNFAPVLNDAGELAFVDTLTGAGVNSANELALFGPDPSGHLSLVAREGDPAPGAPANVFFNTFGQPALNESGAIAFFAGLAGSGVTNNGLWGIWKRDGAGQLAMVAHAGDVAPGTSATYGFFNEPLLNDAGEVAFRNFLSSANPSDAGIFGPDASGNLSLIARVGNPAIGSPSGVTYQSVALPALNNQGEVAFTGSVTGSGVTAVNDDAVWGPAAGQLALLARAGNAAPGTPSGVSYSSFGDPVLNDAGEIAFRAILTGAGVTAANDGAIFGPDGNGNLDLFLREGDAAPGLSAGVLLGSVFSTPVINEAGALLMQFNLTGAGVNSNNDRALYYALGPGIPELIVREGDPVQIAPGDIRVVSFAALLDGFAAEYGRSSFNDAGQVVARVGFTDGSQAILLFAPEPGTGLLVGLGLAAIAARSRRRPSHRR